MHRLQDTHLSGSMVCTSCCTPEIACVGQAVTHASQPLHTLSLILYAITLPPLFLDAELG